MKAAVIRAQGGPEVLRYEDMPDPAPAADEVLIDVEVISIEGGDLLSRRMLPVPGFPHIVGYQAGGRVAALGAKVAGFAIGQRVAAFQFAGSHAEKFVAPAATVFAVPDGLDMRVAATLPVAAGTAGAALAAGGLKAGETVFVQGGSGGVGLAAIQLAKAAGATVFATASSRTADRLREQGCDHPIAHDREDFAAAIARETGGRGVDLVVDMVGGDAAAMAKLVSATAYKGRLVAIGLSSGQAPSLAFWDFVPKNMTIHGVLFGLEMGTAEGRAIVERVIAEAAAGRLTMPIDREFPLSEAAAAHRHAEEARPFGRVLLIP